jgi:hypothetical protein
MIEHRPEQPFSERSVATLIGVRKIVTARSPPVSTTPATSGSAAKAFFRKAFRRHGDPRVITLGRLRTDPCRSASHGVNNDGRPPFKSALARI